MMKRFITNILWAVMVTSPVFFTSCDDDYETLFESYGIVTGSGQNRLTVKTDLGNDINVAESYITLPDMKDSTRLYMQFNIIRETEKGADIRLIYADTILTKNVLPYDETKLDSIGDSPVRITAAWIANGFITFEILTPGSYCPDKNEKHMLNLLRHPESDKGTVLEFRHNDFGAKREKLRRGMVSFRVPEDMKGMEKPVKITVRYKNEGGKEDSLELVYK